ncbi:MAG TPA: undecaprenyl-phosphate glucose phosphotransferase [Ferruginibacter sp.]|nr:undecaprenyl-phosphate glucose phosphotransferase [Ferruginibacter sp.]HMP20199.1 undecaprenyl-phosphate glucose phosphotransferase [Ferruginibacter sp.]
MKNQFKLYLKRSLIVLDLLLINLVYLACKLAFGERIAPSAKMEYLELLAILNVAWFILCFICRTYSDSNILKFESFTKRTVQVYLLWVITVLFYLFFARQLVVSRFFILFHMGFFAVGLLINRFLYLGISNYFKGRNQLFNKVLIIGYNETAKKLEKYFDEEGINAHLLGFVEDEKNITELSRHPILADIKNTIPTAIEMDIQEIYSTITPEQNNFIYTLINKAEMECIRFKVVPDLSMFVNKPVVINYIRDLPVLSLRSEPLDDVGNRIKKRVLDVVVSLFVVIFILSWLVPILGLLIFLESRGPIFFSQLRSGRNNKTFYCHKFRSMRVNKESDTKQATKNDNRITRIGRFIRKTSLDEFPQFINVLKGEMSLVGPRPHMVKHTSDYSKIVDQFMIRQFLKPGITGWAQINGYRGEITEDTQLINRVNDDLWYLENWNIWLDIRIMFLTVYKVFKGDEKAY